MGRKYVFVVQSCFLPVGPCSSVQMSFCLRVNIHGGGVCSAGLDVDKLEYLLRDQHMCFGMHSPGRFNTLSQLETLFRHARIVAVRDPVSTEEGEIVTDIAFENTRAQELVRLVDDIFQTRSVMHERVYQCGCAPVPLDSPLPSVWGHRDASLAFCIICM